MSLYGCVLWDFNCKQIQHFYIAWRKSIRYLLCLPYRTHSVLLPLICDDYPVHIQLCKRFVKFSKNILNHSNTIISLCGKLAILGSNSSVCSSLNYVSSTLKFNKFCLLSKTTNVSDNINKCTNEIY